MWVCLWICVCVCGVCVYVCGVCVWGVCIYVCVCGVCVCMCVWCVFVCVCGVCVCGVCMCGVCVVYVNMCVCVCTVCVYVCVWCVYICLYVCGVCVCVYNGSKTLAGRGLIFIEVSRSHSGTPHTVGLLWTSDQPDAQISICQHTTITTDRPPCPRRDSNPQSQQSNGSRLTPHNARSSG